MANGLKKFFGKFLKKTQVKPRISKKKDRNLSALIAVCMELVKNNNYKTIKYERDGLYEYFKVKQDEVLSLFELTVTRRTGSCTLYYGNERYKTKDFFEEKKFMELQFLLEKLAADQIKKISQEEFAARLVVQQKKQQNLNKAVQELKEQKK